MTSAYVIMSSKLWPKVILRNFGGLLKRIQEQQQRQQQKISKTKVLNKDSYLNYAPLIQVSVKWTLCTVKEEIPFQYSRNFHRKLENSLLHNRGKFHPGGCINESNGVPLFAFFEKVYFKS